MIGRFSHTQICQIVFVNVMKKIALLYKYSLLYEYVSLDSGVILLRIFYVIIGKFPAAVVYSTKIISLSLAIIVYIIDINKKIIKNYFIL